MDWFKLALFLCGPVGFAILSIVLWGKGGKGLKKHLKLPRFTVIAMWILGLITVFEFIIVLVIAVYDYIMTKAFQSWILPPPS